MERQRKNHVDRASIGWNERGERHLATRWILGIVVLTVVFFLGMKVGEFKGSLGYGGYGYMGYPHMSGNYYGNPYYGMPMMWNYGYPTAPVTTGSPVAN